MQQVRSYRLWDTGEVEADAAVDDEAADAADAGLSGSGAPGASNGVPGASSVAAIADIPADQVKAAYRVRVVDAWSMSGQHLHTDWQAACLLDRCDAASAVQSPKAHAAHWVCCRRRHPTAHVHEGAIVWSTYQTGCTTSLP